MSGQRATAQARLEQRLGYQFNDADLLTRALTHASGTTQSSNGNNERLEFLGDRVLGLVIAQLLFERHEDVAEGDLARMLNALVRRQTCARIGHELGLGDVLVLAGKGSKRTVATDNIVGDACEALIAAVYLDGGLDAARGVITRLWHKLLDKAPDMRKDAKSALQEWAAARSLPPPAYETVETTGPDHAPEFTVELVVESCERVRGVSTTIRTAEQAAASAFLKREGVWQ